jgi:hypothetical protein
MFLNSIEGEVVLNDGLHHLYDTSRSAACTEYDPKTEKAKHATIRFISNSNPLHLKIE